MTSVHPSGPATRRARLLATVLVAAVLLAGAGYGVYRLTAGGSTLHPVADHCTVSGYKITPDQAATASTMVGAVTTHVPPMPARAAVLVLAAGLQESKLTNLPPGAGDRDSVGVLQQRPSQGWGHGHAATLNDVGEATREFLNALAKVPHWRRLPLATAVQDVQISADGSAYAQHEPEAQALAVALLGQRPAGISCVFAAPTVVASARVVAQQASYQLGIDTPRGTGHTVRVPGAHWQTAAWLVANADRLGIETVSYDARSWSRTGGWSRSRAPSTAVVAALYRLRR